MLFRSIILSLQLLIAFGAIAQNIVVTTTGENVLYLGANNYFDFASKIIPQKDIILVPQRGELIPYNGRYIYKNCTDLTGPVMIYAISRKTQKKVDSLEFMLRRLPNAYIIPNLSNSWEGVYRGNNMLNDIMSVPCLYSGEFYDTPCLIKGFTITVSDSAGRKNDFPVEGAKFPVALKEKILNDPQKSTVTIHDFRAIQGCSAKEVIISKTIQLR